MSLSPVRKHSNFEEALSRAKRSQDPYLAVSGLLWTLRFSALREPGWSPQPYFMPGISSSPLDELSGARFWGSCEGGSFFHQPRVSCMEGSDQGGHQPWAPRAVHISLHSAVQLLHMCTHTHTHPHMSARYGAKANRSLADPEISVYGLWEAAD